MAGARTPYASSDVAILAYAAGRLAQGAVQSIARNDRSPLVRLEGTLALARVYGKPAAGILAQAFFDAAPEVRREAARALARLDEPNVAGSLCQAIARAQKLTDPEVRVRGATLREALAGLGKDAVPRSATSRSTRATRSSGASRSPSSGASRPTKPSLHDGGRARPQDRGRPRRGRSRSACRSEQRKVRPGELTVLVCWRQDS